MTAPIVVWFGNDLRLADHPALTAAAESGAPVLPLYILDDETAGRLRMGGASRWWLHGSLASLAKDLRQRGGELCLRRGKASEVIERLLAETGASAIHATRGYEPWEPGLAKAVADICETSGAEFRTFGGRLLFEPGTITTGDGKPYRVFTPFWKACLASEAPRAPLPVPKNLRFAEQVTVNGQSYNVSYNGGDNLVAVNTKTGHKSDLKLGQKKIESMYLDHLAFGDLKAQLAYAITNPKSVKPDWLPF